MPIYCVALIPRHCDVLDCAFHSSEFRAPRIWTFLSNLRVMLPDESYKFSNVGA
jgi:hypothetical protein